MATVTKLGPTDHGRAMTLEEFTAGDYEQGYKYELIDGRLYVSPEANHPQGWVNIWLLRQLLTYSQDHPQITNFVTNRCRVFVPGRRRTTCPEPDLAIYRDYPTDRPLRSVRWQDLSPILVGEVMDDNPEKDLVRNVELYLQVPSIREYWLIDIRENADQPTMRVHRRHGQRWRSIDVAFGETYTTKLLPGFNLLLDPHR